MVMDAQNALSKHYRIVNSFLQRGGSERVAILNTYVGIDTKYIHKERYECINSTVVVLSIHHGITITYRHEETRR